MTRATDQSREAHLDDARDAISEAMTAVEQAADIAPSDDLDKTLLNLRHADFAILADLLDNENAAADIPPE